MGRDMGRLENKVVLVTGGARGLGAATAEVMVAEGATVVLADVRPDEGKTQADRLGERATFVEHDRADRDRSEDLREEIVRLATGLACRPGFVAHPTARKSADATDPLGRVARLVTNVEPRNAPVAHTRDPSNPAPSRAY